MIKTAKLKGKKVISLQTGKKLGKITSLIFDPNEKKLEGFVIQSEGILSDNQILRLNEVHSFGPDSVTVKDESTLEKTTQVTEHLSSLAREKKLPLDTPVVTSNGKKIGTIKEMYFNKHSGSLEKIEISQGIEDFESGTKKLKSSLIDTIGQDSVIVKVEAKKLVQKQANQQGVKHTIKRAKNESEDFLSTAEEKSKQAINYVKKKAKKLSSEDKKQSSSSNNNKEKISTSSITGQEIKESISDGKQYLEKKADQVKQKFRHNQKKQALGKYLTKNIISPEDKIIAKRGDMITHQVMKKADSFNLLDQVLDHTSISQPR